MMKTLFVTFVVLSMTAVCQPAPFVGKKPKYKSPNLSGSWHIIAISSEACWFTAYISAFSLPSAKLDITFKDAPNLYEGSFKLKGYGHCLNISGTFFYKKNKTFEVDSNNVPTGWPRSTVLLQSGCSDCIVVEREGLLSKDFLLLSKSKNITSAQLEEFGTQAAFQPHVMDSDYDFENCTQHVAVETRPDITFLGIPPSRIETLKNTYTACVREKVPYFSEDTYDWIHHFKSTMRA